MLDGPPGECSGKLAQRRAQNKSISDPGGLPNRDAALLLAGVVHPSQGLLRQGWGSRSEAGLILGPLERSRSSSSGSGAGATALGTQRVTRPPRDLDSGDLVDSLVQSERLLREASSTISSADSEERDRLHEQELAAGPEMQAPENDVGGISVGPTTGTGDGTESSAEGSQVKPATQNTHTGTSSSESGKVDGMLAITEIWEKLVEAESGRKQSNEQVLLLKQAVAAMTAQHGVKVAGMQRRLDGMSHQENMQSELSAELGMKLKHLESEMAVERHTTSGKLAAALAECVASEEERGRLEDVLAGLEALSKCRLEAVEMRYQTEDKERRAKQKRARQRWKSELQAMEQQVEQTKTENMSTDERELHTQIASLSKQLHDSKTQAQDARSQLSELRLEMLVRGGKRYDERQVEDLKPPALAGDGPAAHLGRGRGTGAGSLPSRAGRGRAVTSRLASIDEDDLISVDGSVCCSGIAVSDGTGPDDRVSDISDESDRENDEKDQCQTAQIRRLTEELAEDRVMHNQKDAEQTSKLLRMTKMLDRLRLVDANREGEMSELKTMLSGKEADLRAQLAHMEGVLKNSRSDFEASTIESETLKEVLAGEQAKQRVEVDVIREQLNLALEARRISDARAEEFKWAMVSLERQHQSSVTEMQQQLVIAHAQNKDSPSTGSTVSSSDALGDIMAQLVSSIEDRNLLQNKLECLHVQRRSELEGLELQNASDTFALKKQHKDELQDLEARYRRELEDTRRRLRAVQKEKDDLLAEKDATPSNMQWLPALINQLTPWCPHRAKAPEPWQAAQTPKSENASACCQQAVWQVLVNMKDIPAVLCTVSDLKITQATKMAQEMLGTGPGQPFLSHMKRPSRAAWFRKAVKVHQDIAKAEGEVVPGLLVRKMGREELAPSGAHSFESPVLTAHLPGSETPGALPPMVLIVLEKPPEQPPRHDQREHLAQGPGSDFSVHASDSLSQVGHRQSLVGRTYHFHRDPEMQ